MLFAGLGMGVALLTVLAVAAVAVYVCYIIAMWKVFTKAGDKGWKALIPFYNVYTQYKLFWDAKIFWAWLGCGVAAGVLLGFGVAPFLAFAFAIATLVLEIMALNKLARGFGHGVPFTVGLVFLEPIFVMILGFGRDEFVGAEAA